jgi:hypothetical protein
VHCIVSLSCPRYDAELTHLHWRQYTCLA